MQQHHQIRPIVRRPRVRRAALVAALLLTIAAGGWPATAALEPAPTAPATGPSVEPVELNSASREQLQSVPGIGPATAARIVAFREEHGPFRRVEDLIKVRGIGETTFQKIRHHVRVATAD